MPDMLNWETCLIDWTAFSFARPPLASRFLAMSSSTDCWAATPLTPSAQTAANAITDRHIMGSLLGTDDGIVAK